MARANDFTELIMWQKASEILRETANDIEAMPDGMKSRRVGDQLFRSVSSISANIAEGFGKRSKREMAQGCIVARGEVDESRNWYYQCGNLNLLPAQVVSARSASLIEVRKMISAFVAQLKQH